MSRQSPNAWKEHIDPELHSAAITLLKYTKLMKEFALSGGLSRLDAITQNNISDGSGWSFLYTADLMKAAQATELSKSADFMKNIFEYFSILSEQPPNLEKFFAHARIMANTLSKHSRDYYMKKIDSVFDGSIFKTINESEGKEREKALQECYKEMLAFPTSILFRYGMQEVDKMHTQDIDVDPSEITPVVYIFISGLFSMMSQIANKSTIAELLAKGDNESLCKAVMVDKSVMNTDLLKKRIAEESLKLDSTFLTDLGAASAEKAFGNEMPQYQTFLVLINFWKLGLNKLGLEDRYYFLSACGLNPPNYPDGIRKFLERNIYPIYGK